MVLAQMDAVVGRRGDEEAVLPRRAPRRRDDGAEVRVGVGGGRRVPRSERARLPPREARSAVGRRAVARGVPVAAFGDAPPVVGPRGQRRVRGEVGLRELGERPPRGLRGIPPLVLGYPKNSSKCPTAVKSNSFLTILGPFILAPRGLDDWRDIPPKIVPEHSR